MHATKAAVEDGIVPGGGVALLRAKAKGQFQVFYRSGNDDLEYQPNFVAEMRDCIVMLEPKMATEMTDKDVLAKRDVAIQWCGCVDLHFMVKLGTNARSMTYVRL